MATNMATSVLYSDAGWDGTRALIGGEGPKWVRSVYAHSETADRYFQVFDAAAVADVTLGTTEPIINIPLENVDDNVQLRFDGAKFQLGIVVAATTDSRGSTAGGTVNYTIEVA